MKLQVWPDNGELYVQFENGTRDALGLCLKTVWIRLHHALGVLADGEGEDHGGVGGEHCERDQDP